MLEENELNDALVLDGHDANYVASVRIRLSVLLSR